MADIRCPIHKCKNEKSNDHLVCLKHWNLVPKEVQKKIYSTYRHRSEEHRKLCFSVLKELNQRAMMGMTNVKV